LGREVTLKEIEDILKDCVNFKSPFPDGWTIEFFLSFWDILGPDVLGMMEESHCKGHIYGALNSTFIALIPKKAKPISFDDYRPISLCNVIYKIISKTIVERLNYYLSKVITNEQFGFLSNRHILDVVGITQEGIHSIKENKLSAIMLKMDLIKAYDYIDWVFLCLILLHVGMGYDVVAWIMACVSSVHFVILVNGSPTGFFQGNRGLRQGCPL